MKITPVDVLQSDPHHDAELDISNHHDEDVELGDIDNESMDLEEAAELGLLDDPSIKDRLIEKEGAE